MIKVIDGFDGVYSVDEKGVIYGTKRQGSKGGIVRQRKEKDGYMRVDLKHNGKRKMYLVHRLVAMNFIPNPDNKPCVNHKDGNKQNNSVDNLEWVTYSENMKHAVEHGLNKYPCFRGEKHPNSVLTESDVYRIHKLYYMGFTPIELAELFEVSNSQILNIVKGKQWKEIYEKIWTNN